MMKAITRIVLIFLTACSLFAGPTKVAKSEIDLMLDRVATSEGLVFIRNGAEFSGKQAADHLRAKLERAGDGVSTAEDFIELCASKSSSSGKNYQVRDGTNKTEDAGVYFKRLLEDVRHR